MADENDGTGMAKAVSGQLIPARLPPSARGIRLGSAVALLREAKQVYKEVRLGMMPSEKGARMIWMLHRLGEMHCAVENETRMIALEERLGL